MKTILRLQITTNLCDEKEAYEHVLEADTDKYRIIDAVQTLYGYEGVTRIDMEVVEVEE